MQKLTLRPGLNAQLTPLLNEGGWSAGDLPNATPIGQCNCIRFREGQPETYGGWVPFLTSLIQGVCRALHAWATLAGIQTLAAGTNVLLYVIQGGVAYDITPVVQTTTPTSPFTTVLSSATVTVVDSGNTTPLVVGGEVVISAASAINGITPAGTYAIQSVISPTSYTILTTQLASGAGTGGGTPTIKYVLPPGSADAVLSPGWGIGPWSAGTWGTARSTGGFFTLAQQWTLDHFGEQLIACLRGGNIYVWLPAGGTGTRAVLTGGTTPTQVLAIFVSNGAEQVFALGGIPNGGVFDPMLLMWCNSGDYTDWTASAINNAGDYQLTDGSQLMWGAQAAQQNLVWSDTALFSVQFISGLLVYSIQQLGTKCGLIGPKAGGVASGIAVWMSNLNFMQYNGTVSVIDCPVRDIVYKNLNLSQASKATCGVNTQFNEVRWDYPSLNSTENDSYVIWNYFENTWTIGGNPAPFSFNPISIARTAWIDVNVFGNPIAADSVGALYQHETGNDGARWAPLYESFTTVALPWVLETGEIDISPGEQMMFLDWMLMDQKFIGASPNTALGMLVSVFARDYSADSEVLADGSPFLVAQDTQYIQPRIRGRQIRLQFAASGAVGVFWRLGAVRIRVAPDGRG